MVLADDDFATIVHAVREGRVIFDNIRKFLRYLLYSNMGEVLTVFLGVVFAGALGLTAASDGGLVLPLLATQILWINLVTDSGPALAMGVDPEIDDVMARPPRGLHDRAIDRGCGSASPSRASSSRSSRCSRWTCSCPTVSSRAAPTRSRSRAPRDSRRSCSRDSSRRSTHGRRRRARSGAALEPLAVGCRSSARAAGRRRIAAAAAGRVRHRIPRRRALARLRGMASVVLWVEELRKLGIRLVERRRA